MTYAETDYIRERAICDAAEAYARVTMATRGPKCFYMTAEESANPIYAACNNEMRSRVARFEIFRDNPDRIYAYLSSDERNVTVWTGDYLGTVSMGTPYKSNFGDMRYPFRTVIDGQKYSGVGYGGGGMYCLLRRVKGA